MTWTLLGVWIAAITSPGPDTLVLLKTATTRTRRDAVLAALGIVVGNAGWITAAFAGVAAILAGMPDVIVGLRLFGGLFLIFMGASGLRPLIANRLRKRRGTRGGPAGIDADAADDGTEGDVETADASGPSPFVAGLLTNLSNPKALVFFGALFVQYAPAHPSLGSYAAILASMVATALLWFVGVAVGASHRSVRIRLMRWTRVIDVAASLIFVTLGVVMTGSAIAELLAR